MRPRHSDVFEEYVKIALEKGLISEEKDNKPSPKKEEKKELSSAEILYGVSDKSNLDLMHEAHPKTIVMGPAYDKFNGVVENLEQRSNMMQFIALKNPQILQSNTRYIKARQDLINETIKLGFYLDNKNQESLMKLADSCTEQLSKEADWKSALLKSVGLIGAGLLAAEVGAQYYPGSQGFKNDMNRLRVEVEEAVADYPNLNFSGLIQNIKDSLEEEREFALLIDDISNKHAQINSSNESENIKLSKLANLGKEIELTKKDKVESISSKLIKLIETIVSSSASLIKQALKEEEKSEGPSSTVWWNIKKLYRRIVLSDVNDVVKMLESISSSASDYKKVINNSKEEMYTLIEFSHKYNSKQEKKLHTKKKTESKEKDRLSPPQIAFASLKK